MEKQKRLPARDRRRMILESALGVFARRGFEGATSRELAAAASVSESLLYKHFPSKEVLYKELVSLFDDNKDEILEKLTSHPAGTRAFVTSFYFLSRVMLFGPPGRPRDDSVDRLIVQSLLSDGEFALAFLETFFYPVVPYLADCLKLAWEAGDIDSPSCPASGETVLFHHFIGMVATFSLPDLPLLPESDLEKTLENALLFGYRGVGFTEAALMEHVDFAQLRQVFDSSLPEA